MNISQGLKDLAGTNFFKSSSIDDIKKLSVVTTRQDLLISDITNVKYFSPADFLNHESWKHDDFDYTISELGLRGGEFPTEIDLAALGCSFTFGQGLPVNMLWHDIVAKNNQLSVYNFGQPGANVKSIADMFALLLNHTKIKHAVFLLPSYHRLQIAAKSKYSEQIDLVPLIPNYISRLETNFEIDGKAIYSAMTDEEMLKSFKDSIYLIEELASHAGVKTYFSSWCNDTYKFMEHLNYSSTLLPQWISSVELQTDFARDEQHPGPQHHIKWANEIMSYIK
jgi:hypothetical protein